MISEGNCFSFEAFVPDLEEALVWFGKEEDCY